MYNLFETNQSNNNELYCVYMHINKINGKRYIGQTKRNPTSRFGRNGSNYHKCPYFYNAIKKYGWNNFEHIIIQDNLTREQANLLEEINIATYNTTNNSFGYNLKAGGDNGGKCSEETKKKISKTQKGKHLSEEHKINISKAKLGHKHSIETKKKLSESNKGKNNGHIPWNKGRTNVYSDDFKQALSESFKGRKYINKDGIIKFVKPDELDKYLNDGWTLGKKRVNKVG